MEQGNRYDETQNKFFTRIDDIKDKSKDIATFLRDIDANVKSLTNDIRTAFADKFKDAVELQKLLGQLMDSDVELMNVFKSIIKDDDYKDVADVVIDISKELFKLQVKIIFDTCFKIFSKVKSDPDTVKLVKELFVAFNSKLKAINAFMDEQKLKCSAEQAGVTDTKNVEIEL